MKYKLIKNLLLFCLFAFITSCEKPKCLNTNPVFDKYSPEEKQYKDELIKQLKLVDKSKLIYTFNRFQEDDSLQYFHISIRGEGLCAKGIITIKKWDDKLESIMKSKGMGYSGAIFKNLRFDFYQDSLKTELIYKSLDGISD